MAGHPIVGCLCIRADSSAAIGVGHVMRCLALSQAWIDQTGHVVFVTHAPIPAIEDRLRKENIDVRPIFSVPGSETDAAETAAIARDCGADWIAVDGYHFSADYHRALRPAGARLLSIDDVAKQDLSEAAVVLNQNVYAKPADYAQLAPLARLLLGTSHALLRREFSAAWTPRPPPARARRVLLTFGGSDPVNATEHMLTLLAKVVVAPLEITVIVGAANTHLPSLRAAAERVPAQHRVEIVETPPNLPERMAAADVALSAAGSTAWELATLGIPMILVVTAENHKRVSERLDQMGAALSLGNLEQASAAEGRSQIAQALASPSDLAARAAVARRLVDGRGARRTVESLCTHPLTLRSLRADDARPVWEWANDPVTRAVSFQSNPIPWERHLDWFGTVLRDCQMHRAFIAEAMAGEPMGIIRFARADRVAELSLNLAPYARGRGWGPKLIRLGSFHAADVGFCDEVRAHVKSYNLQSVAAFRRAGFSETSQAGSGVFTFAWRPLAASLTR